MWRPPHRSTNGSDATSDVARTEANLERASVGASLEYVYQFTPQHLCRLHGLVVRFFLWVEEVPGSNPGATRVIFSRFRETDGVSGFVPFCSST